MDKEIWWCKNKIKIDEMKFKVKNTDHEMIATVPSFIYDTKGYPSITPDNSSTKISPLSLKQELAKL